MPTLNETMGFGGKDSLPGMRTYSPLEGGTNLPLYQLDMTVSAKVDNLSPKAEKRLVTYMTKNLGYTQCVTNKRNNTIYVESITGLDSSEILRYIKKHIDPNAR